MYNIQDAEWCPAGKGWGTQRRRKYPFARLRQTWRKMTWAERRQALRTMREIAVVLGCFAVAVELPGWVEYIL